MQESGKKSTGFSGWIPEEISEHMRYRFRIFGANSEGIDGLIF